MSKYDPGSFNKSGLFIFLFSFGFSILFIFAIAFMHPGIEGLNKLKADAQSAAENADKKEAGFDESSVEKPWVATEKLIAYGEKQYKTNCVACHKADGTGGGPVKARNLIKGEWKRGGTSIALFTTLQKGLEGTSMASFAHLSKVKRWALVHYIRSITKNKVEDDKDKLAEFAKSAD